MSHDFKPYIPAEKNIPELTAGPLIAGVLLGIIFGGSSLYLVLKVGMTVSASIPVAVLSITLFRAFTKVFGLRPRTILENNIVQTTGSAGESIAFGIGVTMPAVMILGFDMHLTTVLLVAVLGGLLGVLMMIPLRQVLIVKEHGNLAYPEGTACAEVLKVGEIGGTSAATVFTGFFVGLIYKFMNVGLHLWAETASRTSAFFRGATTMVEVSPELLGVGYIIGPRIACIMVAGGILSFWVLIPMIFLFGDHLAGPLYPGTTLIKDMGPMEIWKTYVIYIGAGAVAAGGIISLFQTLPTIIRGARAGLGGLKGAKIKGGPVLRTDRDLSPTFVALGSLGLILAIWLAPGFHMNLLGAFLIIVLGFLFVTVSSRLTGQIGSSSNPISGMTVATLLITSLIFLVMGWVSPEHRLIALCVAGIVCVAASNGGTTSQDLKTGYLVGATPKAQQISLLIGALTSALVIGFTLKLLNDSYTYYSSAAVPANTVYERVSELPQENVKADGVVPGSYRVLHLTETPREGSLNKLQPGKYLLTDSGLVKYLVDPGINGALTKDDSGTKNLTRFAAPKARLMSLIIDGILSQKLPWGLVLLGVSIAVVLELCGVASLPFAVGVYLPLSTSAPIFFGGMVRFAVDAIAARRRGKKSGQESAANAEDDTGPGVLYSSGLIAGGSIAGIGLALINIIKWKTETLASGEEKSVMLSDFLNLGSPERWQEMAQTSGLGQLMLSVAHQAESNWLACLLFAGLIFSVGYVATSSKGALKK